MKPRTRIMFVLWLFLFALYVPVILLRTVPEVKPLFYWDNIVFVVLMILSYPIAIYLEYKLFLPSQNVANLLKTFSTENLFVVENNEVGPLREIVDRVNLIIENLNEALFTQKTEVIDNTEYFAERVRLLDEVADKLQTPLGVIKGYAEQVKEGTWEQDESYLEVIFNEVSRMENLINQILVLTRYDYQYEVNESGIDLDSIFNDCINEQAPFIEMKELNIIFTDDLPVVRSDQASVRVAIENIVNNAIKYAYWETDITISASNNVIAVSNVCDPIPEEELEKVHDKYYSTSKDAGLGLSIVKEIFDTLGFEHGIENHENGVSYWFRI